MGTATAPEATEAAAKLAKQEGIDLSDVKGTGAEGRIKVDDVEAIVEKQAKAKEAPEATEAAAAERDDAQRDDAPDDTPDEKPSSSTSSRSRRKSSDKFPSDAHLKGCPQDDNRVEFYDADVPRQGDEPPRKARMGHCVECGATVEV